MGNWLNYVQTHFLTFQMDKTTIYWGLIALFLIILYFTIRLFKEWGKESENGENLENYDIRIIKSENGESAVSEKRVFGGNLAKKVQKALKEENAPELKKGETAILVFKPKKAENPFKTAFGEKSEKSEDVKLPLFGKKAEKGENLEFAGKPARIVKREKPSQPPGASLTRTKLRDKKAVVISTPSKTKKG